MENYDGAETCELFGTYLLSLSPKFIGRNDFGLYRDDSLSFLKNTNGQKINEIRKLVIKTFKNVGFKI